MLSPERLRTALDAAGIGHTIARSLGHPDRWVTACAVSVEDIARVIERLVREEISNEQKGAPMASRRAREWARKPSRQPEPVEPDTPTAAHRGGFSLPAEGG